MTRPLRRGATAFLLLFGLAGTAIACSSNSNTTTAGTTPPSAKSDTTAKKSGSDDSSDTTRRRSTTTEAGSDDGATTSSSRRTTTTSGSSSGGNDSSSPTISVKPTAGNEAFCNGLQEIFNQLAPDFAGLQSQLQGGNAGDISAIEAKVLAASKQLYARMVELGPADVSADLDTVNEVIQKATSFADMTAAAKQPGFLEASQRLSTWLTTNCGVNPQLGQ